MGPLAERGTCSWEKCGQRFTERLEKGMANHSKNYRRVMELNVQSTADSSTKINWLF